MTQKRMWAKLPCINSRGPMPDARHFKYKDQVLVRFISGWYTLGTIIQQRNPYKLGLENLLYLYFRDVRHSHCRLLAGQGCDCPIKGGHTAHCKLHNSGLRGYSMPPAGPMVATAQVSILPQSPKAGQIVTVSSTQPPWGSPFTGTPGPQSNTIPWTGTGKPRRKQYPWRKRP